MTPQSKICAIAAVLCLVIGFFLRGVETLFTVILTWLGIALIFLSLFSRE